MKNEAKTLGLYRREPISIVFGKQTYTALEKDISVIFLSNLPNVEEAQEWDENKEFVFSFRVADHIKESNYTRIKAALDGLNRKRIEIIDDQKKACVFSSIYPETKLEDGEITIHMRGKYIKPYTAISQGYGGWFISEYISLPRLTHKRIFEMCCAAVNKDVNRIETEVQLFKEQIGIGHKYKGRNSEFYAGAVAPAIEAIEERTSLRINGCITRRGRKSIVMLDVFWKDGAKKTEGKKSSNGRQMTLEEGIAKEQAKATEKEKELQHVKDKLQYFEFNQVEQNRILTTDRERQIFTAFCGKFKQDLGVESKANMRGLYLKFLGFCKGKEFATYPEVMDRAKQFDERLANNSL